MSHSIENKLRSLKRDLDTRIQNDLNGTEFSTRLDGPEGWMKKTCRVCKCWIDRDTAERSQAIWACQRSVDGNHEWEYQ